MQMTDGAMQSFPLLSTSFGSTQRNGIPTPKW